MKILVLGSSLRTVGNFLPVIDVIRSRGDEVELAWVPLGSSVSEDPGLARIPHVHAMPPGALSRAGSGEFWSALEQRMRLEAFDAVLMDDMIHWPSRELSALLARLSPRPAAIAFQHGLYQAWNTMNANFHVDYLLCFGVRHVVNFDVDLWPRVLPVGLPKLDRITPADVAGDYILYVAQSAPLPALIGPLLAGIEHKTGLPVRIRAHPGHVGLYASLADRFAFLDPNQDILEQISAAAWMLSTHSTAVLEGMYLGKAAVLLPSFGLTDFTFFPGVCVDFSAEKVLVALKKHRDDDVGRARFLRQVCGGLRHDATKRSVDVIDRIVAREAVIHLGLEEHPLNAVLNVGQLDSGALR